MYRGKVKIITDDEFNHLSSQIVTSNDNLNLKSQNATIEGRRGQRKSAEINSYSPVGANPTRGKASHHL